MTDRLMVVRLVDEEQRTVCVFKWHEYTVEEWQQVYPGGIPPQPQWLLARKPPSRNAVRHAAAAAERRGLDPSTRYPHGSYGSASKGPRHWFTDTGQVRRGADLFTVPGLSLRWDKVVAALDVLAEALPGHDVVTLTVAQFRRHAGKPT